MGETSCALPSDITETILLRLSVKALLRFKSVSKSWNSIISDPPFVEKHHQQSKSGNSQDLFMHNTRSSSEFNLVKLEDKNVETVQVLHRPYNCNDILCRYGGVLLLTCRSKKQVLWNPSTRTHETMWVPFQTGGSSFGLCPDPTTDSFKVVVVNRDTYSVFSVKNKSLIIKRKKFDGLYTDYGLICSDKAICVDAAVYWVLRGLVDKIIYYDPRDDNFKVLQKPQYVEQSKSIFLADLGGLLCLRCNGQDETRIKIWIKEKGIDNYSWKELITIENVDVKMDIRILEPQCLVGNKIIFRRGSILVAYNPLEKTFEQWGDTKLGFDDPLVPYVDSSVGARVSGSFYNMI